MTEPCKSARMRDHACSNRHQCWEPCGELGKSEEHVLAVRCKPGGCSEIGCEGGHYCFNPDGTPRDAKPIGDLNKAFAAGGPLLGGA